jgi:hypothetical protein
VIDENKTKKRTDKKKKNGKRKIFLLPFLIQLTYHHARSGYSLGKRILLLYLCNYSHLQKKFGTNNNNNKRTQNANRIDNF